MCTIIEAIIIFSIAAVIKDYLGKAMEKVCLFGVFSLADTSVVPRRTVNLMGRYKGDFKNIQEPRIIQDTTP